MAVIGCYTVSTEFGNPGYNEDDLLKFAKNLFKDGIIQVESSFNTTADQITTTYKINVTLTNEEYNNLNIHKSDKKPKQETKKPIQHNSSDDEIKGKRSLLDRVFGRNKKRDVLF